MIDHYGVSGISVGDYVLSGGEVAAMVVVDACVRLLPDVLSNKDSLTCESFACGMLEHDQYTRPSLWNKMEVPSVLTSGNHKNIAKWKDKSSLLATLSAGAKITVGDKD